MRAVRASKSVVLCVLGCVALIGACGHGSAVKDRFVFETGCRRNVSVRKSGGETYVVSGCGATATYTCGSNRTHYGDPESGKGVEVQSSVCVRESHSAAPSLYKASRKSKANVGVGKVSRHYDEQRKLHMVRVDFEAQRGIQLALVGAPQAQLGDVLVQVQAPAYRLPTQQCDALEILVNGVPTAGTGFASSTTDDHRTMLRAHFAFEHFKPLAKLSPAFTSRYCKLELELSEANVAQLQKFLVIYSELALEAQRSTETPEPKPDASVGAVSL